MARTDERSGVPFRRLAWLGLGFIGLACVGAGVAYVELLHYRRCAVEHLPAETELAARLDVEQVVLFDPVRRHLLPVLDRLPLGGVPESPNALAEGRSSRIRREAGLNLGLDLREILVAVTGDRRWVVVLGGLFPHALLPQLERALEHETRTDWALAGDALEFAPWGVALGQAEDGALIFASDRATLAAALPSSERFRELGLAREGTGGARLSGTALREWASAAGGPSWLGACQSAGLSLQLARQIELEIQLELRDEATARLVTGLAEHRLPLAAAPPTTEPTAQALDPWGLFAHVERTEVSANANTVKLFSYWRQSELDRAARDAAAWIERRLSVTPSTRAGTGSESAPGSPGPPRAVRNAESLTQ